MLIADGATDADIQSGLALSGDAERKLSGFCRANNLHYGEFWKSALIKERINLKKPEENRELLTQNYKNILLEEINIIKPNILVPLSELAFS